MGAAKEKCSFKRWQPKAFRRQRIVVEEDKPVGRNMMKNEGREAIEGQEKERALDMQVSERTWEWRF